MKHEIEHIHVGLSNVAPEVEHIRIGKRRKTPEFYLSLRYLIAVLFMAIMFLVFTFAKTPMLTKLTINSLLLIPTLVMVA